ncbi:SIR2 family protein [Halochromatium salexigens]|uniref:SIR2 family protein n=1 Tax=Halochromatium salexigens TaxID=49447 RepID=A0AAJ0UH40_HALSE|nr:SIR2 family protein [Halochromatium salexigens]MBK5931362.1 SIR2 family protein [Halochromatium salexigens]
MSIELSDLASAMRRGDLIPYLGPGVLAPVVERETGSPMPADSDSLILAMNKGRPMSKRLMWEFPRAAMDVELKRGRSAVNRFLDHTYGQRQWTRAPLHDWLAELAPRYVIDINRDTQLQESYADRPHTLIRGISRIAGTDYRFRIHAYDGDLYQEIEQDQVDPALPILFKPLGSPRPDATYIASDADFVDYLTELMGGFGLPRFLKEYRVGRQYLFLGLRLTRDTERMVLSDVIYAAGEPAGWALIPEPTDKERRYCEKKDIQLVEADIDELLAADGFTANDSATAEAVAAEAGC